VTAAETYQVSSRTGMRHKVPGPPPSRDTVLAMWQGKVRPAAVCGRSLTVVNFYEPGEVPPRRWACSRCFPPVSKKRAAAEQLARNRAVKGWAFRLGDSPEDEAEAAAILVFLAGGPCPAKHQSGYALARAQLGLDAS
jgi:hypothetical protein